MLTMPVHVLARIDVDMLIRLICVFWLSSEERGTPPAAVAAHISPRIISNVLSKAAGDIDGSEEQDLTITVDAAMLVTNPTSDTLSESFMQIAFLPGCGKSPSPSLSTIHGHASTNRLWPHAVPRRPAQEDPKASFDRGKSSDRLASLTGHQPHTETVGGGGGP